MYSFIAAIWPARSVAGLRGPECLQRLSTQARRWTSVFEAPGILVMQVKSDKHCWGSYPLQRKSGVVLGQLFDRRCHDYSQRPAIRFDESETRNVIDTAGQHLIDHYWGSYLTILRDHAAERVHVFRDPLGTLPCYHARHAGVDLFFSHLEDCLQLAPLSLAIDRHHLTKWLMFTGVHTDSTGLEHVTHLPRGERLTISPTATSRARIWDPTAFASAPGFHATEAAARALRSTVQNVVDAWSSRYQRIALKLSGGLDSAILAGCLARTPSAAEVVYLNLIATTEATTQTAHLPGIDPRMAMKLRSVAAHGDERHFAQLVANRWNRPLIMRARQLSMDLERLRHVPLSVAPALYFTVMELDDAALEMVATHGTQAFFSGQAGDAVLLSTLQPFGAIDHAFTRGLSKDLWRHIEASSALSKDSLWSVLGKTFKHGLLRRPYIEPIRILDRPTLLRRALVDALREEDFDSGAARLARLSSLPPGKKNHVRGVASAFDRFVFAAGEHAEHIDPLNSQPIWELMLAIPTETALMNGTNRGLARHAFADLLPEQIRRRQSKGTGTLFYQDLVRRNRHQLLQQLESGLLVREGFLDRERLTSCLTAEEPSMITPPGIILTYLAAEIWLQQVRSWSAHDRRPAAREACASGNIVPLWPDRNPHATAASNETSPGYDA